MSLSVFRPVSTIVPEITQDIRGGRLSEFLSMAYLINRKSTLPPSLEVRVRKNVLQITAIAVENTLGTAHYQGSILLKGPRYL